MSYDQFTYSRLNTYCALNNLDKIKLVIICHI